MTYPVYEISVDNGQPVQLFEITYSGQSWYYTSSDSPVTHNGKTYAPAPISCVTIPGVVDATQANVSITMPRDYPVPELFRVMPPSERVFVSIYNEHLDDPDAQFMLVWKGTITNCEWQGAIVNLNTDSIFTSMLRAGLGPRWSKQCTATIYDSRCGLARENFKVTGVAGTHSGTTLTVPTLIGKTDNYFAGGYITWENNANGNTEIRFIRSSYSATGNLTLASMPMGLSAGQAVSVYPGCDHLLLTCDSKFGNTNNFRGAPYIPSKSPFGGTALY